MGIPAELLEILACPKCHGEVRLDDEKQGFVCEACELIYPIEDDIPNFLIDEAKPLGG
jgi:uncharacterized protein YbaR (Trm112 family)